MDSVEIAVPSYLNPVTIADLNRQLLLAEKNGSRFVVLKGSSEIFSNGLDLRWVTENIKADFLPEMQAYASFLKKLQTGKFIAVANVSGTAAGGGMGIVCACDYVVAESNASFALPEGLLGLVPGMILPALLNRLTPLQVKQMVFTGKKYAVEEVTTWALIDKLANSPNEALQAVSGIIKSNSCKPGSISSIKNLLYHQPSSKDELGKMGMEILAENLRDETIRERLKNIAEFLE